jgi:AraC family L-rhamnose operon regulatory protein RhaS
MSTTYCEDSVGEAIRGYTGRDIYPGYTLAVHKDDDILPFDPEHPRFALHYVHAGTRQFLLQGRLLTLTAPALFFLDASRPELVRDLDARTQTLHFDPAIINGAFTPETLAKGVFETTTYQDRFLLLPFLGEASRVAALNPDLQKRVEQGFARVETEGTQQRDWSWPCRTRAHLIELLFQVRLEEPADFCVPGGESPTELAFARALADVRTRFTQPLSVDELSRAAGTNRTTLNEEFRRRTGHSVHSYQIALRLELASALLRDTDLSVAQITPRVGYEDQSHFGRVFRSRYGVSPARYREELRETQELSFRTTAL